ncbi:MAG: hypothetical protein HOA40_04670 [Porticoccaceae bacterium]|jgi:hypothetical protein|nr:hypothetical protein [Porticoccaceae bacterium]MBT4212423.1 hypothetical protein [Porticoccaceae bacterium]MBT4592355.1 hypothetical protein [Porticoccaceae bacterium]MBT6421642.1 hypothetical protein [Porticoccaceae bacterium]MBT6692418.1 hypothetical protein [Porticoccaceae bacterium]|tara:strand:- start:1694 stop:2542 length:849 start_codon:yes stop_codon:yes gene_type:complete
MTSTYHFKTAMLYNAFKYTVYALLMFNIVLFFQEELLATEQTFSQGINLVDVIQGFAATIDTAAWVLLLLLFELETSVLDDDTLRRTNVKVTFIGLRIFSYGFVGYAFYGYFSKMLLTYNISPFVVDDLCAMVGQGYAGIVTLDEYPLLDTDSCAVLADQTLFKLNGQQILGNTSDWVDIQWLAWLDVINSATWVAVVVILEVDVWLQLRGRLQGGLVSASRIIKILLYSILFFAAAYWGLLGDFLDFWDAFMWLVAFVFVEMNLFQWQVETSEVIAEDAVN